MYPTLTQLPTKLLSIAEKKHKPGLAISATMSFKSHGTSYFSLVVSTARLHCYCYHTNDMTQL